MNQSSRTVASLACLPGPLIAAARSWLPTVAFLSLLVAQESFAVSSSDTIAVRFQNRRGIGIGASGMEGWQFMPAADLRVTSLGLWDGFNGMRSDPFDPDFMDNGDGLFMEHPVAIWDLEDASGPVVSAVIPAGTMAPLVEYFRYVDIDPVVLRAGRHYAIVSWWTVQEDLGEGNMGFSSSPGFVLETNPAIDFEGYRGSTTLAFGFPNFRLPGEEYMFGPNFAYTVVSDLTNHRPELTAPMEQTVTEGLPWSTRVRATDPDGGDSLTFSFLWPPPEGMTIDSATGEITWTPSEASWPGTYTIGLRVEDNGTPPRSDTGPLFVTLQEVNQPPVLTVPPDQVLGPGQSLAVIARATDPDLPANSLRFRLVAAPEGMSIHPGSGSITWTPTPTQRPGTYLVEVEVTDDGNPPLRDTETFTVSVFGDPTSPPVANPDSLWRKAGRGTKWRVAALLANDSDPDGESLVLAGVNPRSSEGGALQVQEGWVTYEPPPGGDPSLDTFTYTVSDPLGHAATGTVSVRIATPDADPSQNILSVTGGFPHPATVRFAGIPGRYYTIQSSVSVSLPVWTTLGAAIVGESGIGEFTDTTEAPARPVLYYRTVRP